MQILLPQHRNFLVQLLEAGIEFIVIGGYAVIYHGYPRTTDDLDIWINNNDENKERLLAFLTTVGIDVDDLRHLQQLDFRQPRVFHIGDLPERIDFLTQVQGLDFNEAAKVQVYFNIEGVKVPLLHVEHLIINKLLSDRLQDKADVEELQKILRLKK